MVSILLPWKISSDRNPDFWGMKLSPPLSTSSLAPILILYLKFIKEVGDWKWKNLTSVGKQRKMSLIFSSVTKSLKEC